MIQQQLSELIGAKLDNKRRRDEGAGQQLDQLAAAAIGRPEQKRRALESMGDELGQPEREEPPLEPSQLMGAQTTALSNSRRSHDSRHKLRKSNQQQQQFKAANTSGDQYQGEWWSIDSIYILARLYIECSLVVRVRDIEERVLAAIAIEAEHDGESCLSFLAHASVNPRAPIKLIQSNRIASNGSIRSELGGWERARTRRGSCKANTQANASCN